MNILILGSGGREHTLCWKIKQSDHCDKLYVAPGNAGTEAIAENVGLNISDFEAIGDFCLDSNINMVVVGPEAPLVQGIYDYFEDREDLKKIHVLGPSEEGAQLEGSKAYAKKFMQRHNIPTAGYAEFTLEKIEEGLDYIEKLTPPVVLKCDGLAAGKGVVILDNIEDAKEEFSDMLYGKFGGAGNVVVIEDFLDGIEFSVFVLTDGDSYKILPVAKDYKRIGEGDTGLNTGGMGAVSPPPFVDDALMEKVVERIVEPTVNGLKEEDITYKGIIFLGLIRVGQDPYVIEYNCRLGDPETEAVLPRISSDLLEIFASMFDDSYGAFAQKSMDIIPQSAATIMLVSGGYPEAYEKGKVMSIPNDSEDTLYFHAGTTTNKDGQVVTNGGRVLAITSFDENFNTALEKSNKHAELIDFDGKNYRKDIGFDL